jgi:hypothetical protein
MMDFLRGLAPAHADARHRAVVAPRSRYETDQPIRPLPRTAAPEVEHDERAASMPERANRSIRPLEIDDVSSPLVTHDRPKRRLTREAVDLALRPPAAAIVTAHPELEAAVRTTLVEGQALPPASATSPQGSLVLPAVGRRPSHAVSEPARTAVPTRRERAALASRPERSVDNGPLSQQALASRVLQQSDRPPIVHVTIDRVDVRAPAAPERPAPRTRSRTATAGSLTDYLRARPAGRQGGTS